MKIFGLHDFNFLLSSQKIYSSFSIRESVVCDIFFVAVPLSNNLPIKSCVNKGKPSTVNILHYYAVLVGELNV